MEIKLVSVMVEDQEEALQFYTGVLGFKKSKDIPMGEFRWLTVVSPETDDIELVLEPMGFEPAKIFQKALFEAGVPALALNSKDIADEYERLVALGVVFRSEPKNMGTATIAMFEDTCGNIIQIYQADDGG